MFLNNKNMNEEQYDKAISIIDKVMDAEPNTLEFDVLDLLADLVVNYEEKMGWQ